MTKAVAKWDALELEEAIIEAKGAGGMVRTMEEWATHPQAAAIASLPLMEIVKIADSPPEPLLGPSRVTIAMESNHTHTGRMALFWSSFQFRPTGFDFNGS